MSGLLKELFVDPYHRLKWGFLPVKRIVEDLPEDDESINSTSITAGDEYRGHETELHDLKTHETNSGNGDISSFSNEKEQGILEVTNLNHRTNNNNNNDNGTVDVEYEYRDEADRKWWKFFDEQEYRINKEERSHNKWYSWFKEGTSYEEKKLLLKLDVLLAFYSCMAYWIKYLDTVNVNNAYVSHMKEDLNFKADDLVHVQVMYTVGNIIFQIPFLFYLNKVPLNYVLPVLDLCWSLLTVGAAYVDTVPHLKAIRFFIGAFEAPSYLAYQYLFGSFYKHDEMVRRSAFYYLGQFIGILSAGGIQSAVFSSLDGVNGLAGWRWNFIIDAIISVVVGIIGFYSLPGDPYNCYSIFLTDDEIRLARRRLKENQTGKSDFNKNVFDLKLWKAIFSDWKIYILSLWNIFCWNDSNVSSGAYLLWLKSLDKYTIPKVNKLSMITPGLGIVYLILTGVLADKSHSRWFAIIFTQVFNIIGNSILAAWDVSEGAKWFGFILQCFGWAMAPVLYSWQNDICRKDSQTRAITLVTMNILAQSSTAWISVLVWKTEEAPRYLKGFTFTACSGFCLSVWTFVVLYFYKRDERNNSRDNGIIVYNSKLGEDKPIVEELDNNFTEDVSSSSEKEKSTD
ncbi:similar to Saccharomyces cerevisiae YAL067C SEO1 Putative permease, member of the allantoate transporter subfamily of the major facilitator superfamily [Maudiozyma barnettii]|uniref:Similar to Saccharomyces cerevisiae YAL067C SEO1 Putative permease, member of the allantoate transporter subfamily of the major facilitator superfamily n=1 Tax=Maudiozyma barnettii TaxID=61262 RepID=A0A8H2ZJZ8_9SACH|nr:putative permease SEO1 [Kazachstania barnettii]CAB4257042.1 similar to Saccharomyces cerevisiae YAL067C SEO1 Putative permease, member of the allantoate transporter subfamily of the major facilitator superfamily [Kazachstania barnettii]CAD1779413.1 similar to Saccharomyces cerevisiae YAL067C SEO1 Putative permease, member of the allantoate transporter subfamily of the major facilitator superfamily [Kazachstania barnettii]